MKEETSFATDPSGKESQQLDHLQVCHHAKLSTAALPVQYPCYSTSLDLETDIQFSTFSSFTFFIHKGKSSNHLNN